MVCAQEALAGLGLDRVVLLPVHTPPHKQLEDEPGVEHRLELCRLAAAGAEGIEVAGDRGRSSRALVHDRYPEKPA